jgi:ankyrin repeat protein
VNSRSRKPGQTPEAKVQEMRRIDRHRIRPTLAQFCLIISAQLAHAGSTGDGGDRTLLAAIRNGDKVSVQALFAKGASIHARDGSGATALMHAALNADTGMMRSLLDRGAHVNAESAGGATALLWALHDPEKVKLLLDHGAKVSEEAVFASVAVPRAGPVIRLLADAGADFNVSKKGFTPLMAATRSGNLETIQFLIARGADVKARNRLGFTALYGAASWPGNSSIVKLLLENGADANVRVEVSEPARDVYTALMSATLHGDAPLLEALLDHRALCNVQGGDFGRTALLMAATTGNEETVKRLLARNADLNAADRLGNTPVQWARRRGSTGIVQLLIKAGARHAASTTQTSDRPPLRTNREARTAERALAKSLPLLQRSGLSFSEQRGCVSCHHQSLVAMAVASARKQGFAVNGAIAAEEQARTLDIMAKSRERMLLGSGATDELAPAYILAGLDAGGFAPNQATDALVQFLVLRQQRDGSWKTPVYRPPQDASEFTITALAVRGLRRFGPKGRMNEIEGRIALARGWLVHSAASETEELAFRLLGLCWAGADRTQLELARGALLRLQRDDGGWAQLATLASDAYATGLAIFALREGGGIDLDQEANRRGIEYLLNTQLADGSWFVQTRSFPVQPFVETRFPHGRSQFISLAATCWASLALSLATERIR